MRLLLEWATLLFSDFLVAAHLITFPSILSDHDSTPYVSLVFDGRRLTMSSIKNHNMHVSSACISASATYAKCKANFRQAEPNSLLRGTALLVNLVTLLQLAWQSDPKFPVLSVLFQSTDVKNCHNHLLTQSHSLRFDRMQQHSGKHILPILPSHSLPPSPSSTCPSHSLHSFPANLLL